ncbi:MAG: thiol reductant ABC exporter subunit CydC [Xanthomonadaceae bacterium]|nr:thiol reductant ABC exporter subunit CydC [Xanthomonadaceae bacterium]
MTTLKQLLWPGRNARPWLLAATALAALSAGFALLLLALSGWLITASALAGLGTLAVLDIFAPGAGIRASAIGRTVARYFERLIGHESTFRQLARVRIEAFRRLLDMPIDRLDGLGQGDTLNRLTRDIDTLDHLVPRLLVPSASTALVTVLAAIGLSLMSPLLGVIIAVVFGLGSITILALGVRRARQPGFELAMATPAMRRSLSVWLQGLAELVSLGRATGQAAGILELARDQIQAQRQQRHIEAAMHSALAIAGALGFWLVFLAGLWLHQRAQLAAPMVAAAALVALALADAILPLAGSWSFLETCRRAAERVDQLGQAVDLAEEPEKNCASQAVVGDADLIQRGGSVHTAPTQALVGSLALRDLGFRYGKIADPVFEHLELDIQAGERITIQGKSGSGKTTLARLLAGVLKPGYGSVVLGGYSLADLADSTVRSTIGYLPQQPILFKDTLGANLRLARPDASDARLTRVLEMLELGGLLGSLPNGLESWIGEYGRTVSGGEARRLALARLVLADFPVLILDEPTAGIDLETARRINPVLEQWMAERTVVMLSHDPDSLPRHDRLLSIVRHRVSTIRYGKNRVYAESAPPESGRHRS